MQDSGTIAPEFAPDATEPSRFVSIPEKPREWIWLVPMTAIAALSYCVAVFAVGANVAADLALRYLWKASLFVPILALVVLTELVSRWLLNDREGLARARSNLSARLISPREATATIVPILLLIFMSTAMGLMKMALPAIHPFSWDATFARADGIMFHGYQPWQLTHFMFGSKLPTLALDRVYTLWVYLLPVAISAVALFAPKPERAQFFLTYAIVISGLGIAGAWLFSSAGPCFAPLLSKSLAGDFQPLLDRLHSMSERQLIWAVQWQSILWGAYRTHSYDVGMGISAMPSIHVALAVLYALLLARFGSVFAWLGRVFAVVIFIGSIHLGWHYAVDGLASGFATILIWGAVSIYLHLSGFAAAAVAED